MSDVEEDIEDQAEGDLDADELGEDEEISDLDAVVDTDLDAELDDTTSGELKVVEEVLSQKEQNARAFAVRRALEERAEKRRLHEDLDYLDD